MVAAATLKPFGSVYSGALSARKVKINLFPLLLLPHFQVSNKRARMGSRSADKQHSLLCL